LSNSAYKAMSFGKQEEGRTSERKASVAKLRNLGATGGRPLWVVN
jgi:hypothetical protein